ncbi:MAG TPA: hypothetical protein VHZ06_07345 [Marmoricola sp.]|nr:hypothetical protein [Marmoricola sp.]
MARRVSLPAADDLFRPTSDENEPEATPAVKAVPEPAKGVRKTASRAGAAAVNAAEAAAKASSGRVRHDEKMTVYVTADELVDIEHARLDLRRHHGLAVDRGRLVREALAIVLADLEEHGDDSELVRRLLG